jgi:hypothetical protein
MSSYTRRLKPHQYCCQNLKSRKLLHVRNVALTNSRNAFPKKKIFFHKSSVHFLLFAVSEIRDMRIAVIINKHTVSCYSVGLMMLNITTKSFLLINLKVSFRPQRLTERRTVIRNYRHALPRRNTQTRLW